MFKVEDHGEAYLFWSVENLHHLMGMEVRFHMLKSGS